MTETTDPPPSATFWDSVLADEAPRYAVPGLSGYGPEFPTFAEAVAHARSTIVTFDYGDHTTDSRAFVDQRQVLPQANGTVDTLLTRYEVFADHVKEL